VLPALLYIPGKAGNDGHNLKNQTYQQAYPTQIKAIGINNDVCISQFCIIAKLGEYNY
jgi:hypothetical protein